MPNNGMIDLGSKPQEIGKASTPSEDKTYYPTLRISNVEGLDDLPDGEFTFTAKGEVVSHSEDLKNGTCSCEIEIHSISPNAKKVKKVKDAGERLDDSLDKIAKHKIDDYENAADESDE